MAQHVLTCLLQLYRERGLSEVVVGSTDIRPVVKLFIDRADVKTALVAIGVGQVLTGVKGVVFARHIHLIYEKEQMAK